MADSQYLDGLDNFLELASSLPKELVSKRGGVVLRSLRQGGNIMADGIRDQIKRIIDEPNIAGEYRSTGLLIDSVRVARARNPKRLGGDEAIFVGVNPRKKYPDGTNAGLVAGVLENGTEHMEAKAPVRKAFEANKQAALNAVVKSAVDGINAAVKKFNRKPRIKRR